MTAIVMENVKTQHQIAVKILQEYLHAKVLHFAEDIKVIEP